MCICRSIHSIFPMQTQTTSYMQNQQINLISTLGKLVTQSTAWMADEVFAATVFHGVLGSPPQMLSSAGCTAAFSPFIKMPMGSFLPVTLYKVSAHWNPSFAAQLVSPRTREALELVLWFQLPALERVGRRLPPTRPAPLQLGAGPDHQQKWSQAKRSDQNLALC